MTLIKPFRALRPGPGRAADVLAPPYDVLSSAEARTRAAGKPWSFLHVSKAEIDQAARQFNNVVMQTTIELKAVKAKK